MEMEKFEELYQIIDGHKQMDETSGELYEEIKRSAYKYADMRYRFSEMNREQKMNNDSHRTSLHDCFMDNVHIYFRYLQNNGIEPPDISKMDEDRKVFGNFACYFIFRVECEQA